MRRLLLVCSLFLMNACIQEEATLDMDICAQDPSSCEINCQASPICMDYTTQVDTCENQENCYRNTVCGNTIYCQVIPECVGFVDISALNTESTQDVIDDMASAAGVYIPEPISEINQIDSCEKMDLSDIGCESDEVDSNSCFVYQYEHPCFGFFTEYCRPRFEGACAIDLTCQEGETQVESCHLGQDDCYTLNSCAGTIFCQKAAQTCSNAQVPENTPIVADCDAGILNSEPCLEEELLTQSCAAMLVPNYCMGTDLFYCHQERANCDAYPSCQIYEQEVASCDGLENCQPVSLCGSVIYCQTKPECVDASSQDPAQGQAAPMMLMPSKIDLCEPAFISDMPCDMNEITQNQCFAYPQTDICYGDRIQYCRPVYQGACAYLVQCEAGDMQIDACYVGDDTCYTMTGCAGTVFCRRI